MLRQLFRDPTLIRPDGHLLPEGEGLCAPRFVDESALVEVQHAIRTGGGPRIGLYYPI